MNAVTSRGLSAPIHPHTSNPSLTSDALAGMLARTKVSEARNPCPESMDLRRLLSLASGLESDTGKVSPLWGRIGELYAAFRYGIRLSRKNAQGHDGRLDNDLVEIKTITPRKRKAFVRVKRAGNFNKIAVVRIRPDLQVEVRMVRRDRLPTGNHGAYFKLSWHRACAIAESMD